MFFLTSKILFEYFVKSKDIRDGVTCYLKSNISMHTMVRYLLIG